MDIKKHDLYKNKVAELIRRSLIHPTRTLLFLFAIVVIIEVAQYWPEWIVGGHAVGEIIRNLSYAVIAAVVFHWIVVEYPERQRRERSYLYHKMAFQFLAGIGLSLLNQARYTSTLLKNQKPLNIWDRREVQKLCADVWLAMPPNLRQERYAFLNHALVGVETSLDGVKESANFFDAEVAQAIAHFPSSKGLHQLQMLNLDDPEQAFRYGHITWELLSAGRRLYKSLSESAVYLDLQIEESKVSFGDGKVIYHRESDLLRDAN